ncbi:hypothetical protein Nepgr_019396 [Nepenthes gracilis]|uniref:Uncharacterized protein n=1 Tax=Nepenthes gracilis TaxID=150966 RepID=A0AAD3STH0_NEPGR|nr:hypothetical protein Nepgr_019396 [Nepenthes gracilis]
MRPSCECINDGDASTRVSLTCYKNKPMCAKGTCYLKETEPTSQTVLTSKQTKDFRKSKHGLQESHYASQLGGLSVQKSTPKASMLAG